MKQLASPVLLLWAAQAHCSWAFGTQHYRSSMNSNQRLDTWRLSASLEERLVDDDVLNRQSSAESNWHIPVKNLAPPFPNGPCGGTLVTLPPEDTFKLDVSLSGNDIVLPPRPIRVWLPPDYDGGEQKRHPVLYCHDGQNAMMDEESWTGRSWRLMGGLTRWMDHSMASGGEKPQTKESSAQHVMPIVVLLPSVEGDLLPGIRRRHLEYGGLEIPFAKAHTDFVAKTVKPLVDSLFATEPAAESTFAIGSSMGGQASLNLLLQYPNLFGGAACLSPFFAPTTLDRVRRVLRENPQRLTNKRIYMDIGGDLQDKTVPFFHVWDHVTPKNFWNPGYFWLDTSLQGSVREMRDILERGRVPHCYIEVPAARHNEWAWSNRIHWPISFLFDEALTPHKTFPLPGDSSGDKAFPSSSKR